MEFQYLKAFKNWTSLQRLRYSKMLPLCSGSHDEDCDDDYDQDKEEDDDDYDHNKEEDDDSSPADNSASALKLAVYQELSLSDDLYLIYLYPNKLVVHHDKF